MKPILILLITILLFHKVGFSQETNIEYYFGTHRIKGPAGTYNSHVIIKSFGNDSCLTFNVIGKGKIRNPIRSNYYFYSCEIITYFSKVYLTFFHSNDKINHYLFKKTKHKLVIYSGRSKIKFNKIASDRSIIKQIMTYCSKSDTITRAPSQ